MNFLYEKNILEYNIVYIRLDNKVSMEIDNWTRKESLQGAVRG